MKQIIPVTVASLILLTGCMSTPTPTATPASTEVVATMPQMATAINFDDDSREWAQVTANDDGSYAEYVPAGDSQDEWKEIVIQEAVVTTQELEKYIVNWVLEFVATDSGAKLKKKNNKDGSITVIYSSASSNKIGFRRFIKGPDGIYMLTYQVRPEHRDAATTATWDKIVAEASLIRNPQVEKYEAAQKAAEEAAAQKAAEEAAAQKAAEEAAAQKAAEEAAAQKAAEEAAAQKATEKAAVESADVEEDPLAALLAEAIEAENSAKETASE